MNKLTKNLTCGLLAASLGIAGLTGCASKNIDGTQKVLTVEEQQINLGVASFMLRYSQAQMQSYLAAMGGGDIWSEEYVQSTKDSIMEQLETMLLLKNFAGDYDVALTEEDNKKIDETAQAFMDANGEDVIAALGVSKEDIKTVLELYTYQEKMYDPMTKDVDTEVSDEEASQSTYSYISASIAPTTGDDGEEKELTEDEKAAKKKLLETVLSRMKESEDPATADMKAIAQEVDESLVSSRTSYGKDDETVDEAIRKALEGKKDGEVVSEIVETDDVYYVLRMDKVFDEEKTESKKETIVAERKNEAYKAKIEEWKKNAKIAVVDKEWDKLKISNSVAYSFKAVEAPEEETPPETSETPQADVSQNSTSQNGDTGSVSGNAPAENAGAGNVSGNAPADNTEEPKADAAAETQQVPNDSYEAPAEEAPQPEKEPSADAAEPQEAPQEGSAEEPEVNVEAE